jgi:DNA-binding NarL/FixJ family response regulator
VVTSFMALEPGLKIVGVAHSGREALKQLEQLQPSLVLMDVTMPDANGLDITRIVKEQPAAPYVIILTLHNNSEYRAAAAAAGADGFVPKWEVGTKLLPLIQTLFKAS